MNGGWAAGFGFYRVQGLVVAQNSVKWGAVRLDAVEESVSGNITFCQSFSVQGGRAVEDGVGQEWIQGYEPFVGI